MHSGGVNKEREVPGSSRGEGCWDTVSKQMREDGVRRTHGRSTGTEKRAEDMDKHRKVVVAVLET